MGKTIIEHYFAKRIGDNSQDDKKFLNGRVFNTVDRFVRTKKKGGLSGRLLDVGCGDGAFFVRRVSISPMVLILKPIRSRILITLST